MDGADTAWSYLTKLPQLLNEYSGFSYPLLGVLLVAGALLLGMHLYRKRAQQAGLSAAAVMLGALLLFLSSGGFFLKYVGSVQAERARTAFITDHRVPAGEHWLLVFDFALPANLDAAARQQYLGRMENLVAAMSEVLLEDLPQDFRQPRVVRIPTSSSPWHQGIGQGNFEEVITELNAFEIMWGNVHEQGDQAKAFLGIPRQLAQDLDTIIPLRDFAFGQDVRREHQFGDGYYRLLGLVTLGMALDTHRQAGQAAGDERRRLFLQAVQQLNKARELVNNRRDDPILQRTLYSAKVDELINVSLNEAGLTP